MYTHKNSLRQNEDKAIEDCYLCSATEDVKCELLVKCLLCRKYAHPTCLETKLKVAKCAIYIDEAKNKFGFVCCSGSKRRLLVETTNFQGDLVTWTLKDLGVEECMTRSTVKEIQ